MSYFVEFLDSNTGARGTGITPDSWLRHRDFKNIFQAEPNASDLAQRARTSKPN